MAPCSSKIKLKLANEELWQKFPQPMEMLILMKTGKKLFPTLEYSVDGLDKDALYEVELHMERANNNRYNYSKIKWLESESDLPNTPTEKVKHSNGILTGEQWMADSICFESVRLTNDPNLKSPNHICVQSMHKWRPVVTIRKISTENAEEGFEKEFRLEETCFIAVTIYHNRDLVYLKLANNLTAAAYREQTRRKKNRVVQIKGYQSIRSSNVFSTPSTTPGVSSGLSAPGNALNRHNQPAQANIPRMGPPESGNRISNGRRPGPFNIRQSPMTARNPTLVDMPVKLMHKICEYLDPVERTHLRSMNHAIKDVVDCFAPAFEKIEISVLKASMFWELNNKMFSCRKKDSGCTLDRPECLPIEESEKCYIKKGLEYLVPVMKMPRLQVDHLSLCLHNETPHRVDLLPVAPLNAKNVFIKSQNINQMVQFLSAMNPGHLESIRIETPLSERSEDRRVLFETDQFKQAKRVEFDMIMQLSVEDLVHFGHLKSFKCRLLGRDPFQHALRIREILSTFKQLDSCEMRYYSVWNDSPIREFAGALGVEIPIGPIAEHITHRYQIPESNESLEFKMKDEKEHCRVNIAKIR
ncbi:hypothetical protein B9Z55_003780 [Caenorhabditis nigoni]|uniref:Uncharacterized protein n=1 Tax=Caenorhabditis nigoni TaxID=1611254 RepID=A0A2G5VS03_9PELO|nr:hypothetical protein B9Z55_003780 [Caenorhabditis nigoni]